MKRFLAVVVFLFVVILGGCKQIDNNRTVIKFASWGSQSEVSVIKPLIEGFERQNPDIKVELDKIRINELNYFNIIQGYDIIVDCFDSYESKYMLNEIALRHKKILIHGATQGFYGQVTTIIPDKTGCLECVMQKPANYNEITLASLSSVVNTISALQAQEVLKVLTNTGKPLLDKLLVFDGLTSEFKTLSYAKNLACPVCSVNNIY